MPSIDKPLAELERYQSDEKAPTDFDAFWARSLQEAAQFPLNARFDEIESGLSTVQVYDVTFSGFGGQPIKGWFLAPRQRRGLLPCVVEYIGYGGGRGLPHDWLLHSSAGYAHLVMDTRGQGSVWRRGDTPDIEMAPGNPQFPGFLTRGILDPDTYYYRRLIIDSVRAVEAAAAMPLVDHERIAVYGSSQGGGLAIATAALSPRVKLLQADVPFLSHFRRAIDLVADHAYSEIAKYLAVHYERVEQVLENLSYFDTLHFAPRVRVPAIFSTGLWDQHCPPSTVYAVYQRLTTPKAIYAYPYNAHEGGGSAHQGLRLAHLKQL